MDIQQCANGHYFDVNRYPDGCPYCRKQTTVIELQTPMQDTRAPKGGSAPDEGRTMPLNPSGEQTIPLNSETALPIYVDAGTTVPLPPQPRPRLTENL